MFHDVRFPTAISRGSSGGPEFRTQIQSAISGHETRNARWSQSRRRYNAGYGVRSLPDLHAVIAFFEARHGRLYGFRWRDHADNSSSLPGQSTSPQDMVIGTGDGSTLNFQLSKRYQSDGAFSGMRLITKPIDGTVRVAIDGQELVFSTDFAVNHLTGVVTFPMASPPAAGAVITAGFEFDTPVRFESDHLDVSLSDFSHGSIPNIALVELRE